jgi:hypothetical protein
VRLLWCRTSGSLTVLVSDTRASDSFQLVAGRENALDVFNHPYAYAALPQISPAGGLPAAVEEPVLSH